VLLDERCQSPRQAAEELRTELPRIFEASGAIFVYATTEPSKRYCLAARTVRMWEGEILQPARPRKVYRHPDTLRVAQVFSDPPPQHRRIEKTNGLVQLPAASRRRLGLYAVLATAPTGSASRPSARSRQRNRGRHAFRRPSRDRNTGSEVSCISIGRCFNWSPCCMACTNIARARAWMRCSIQQCLCVRRGRPLVAAPGAM